MHAPYTSLRLETGGLDRVERHTDRDTPPERRRNGRVEVCRVMPSVYFGGVHRGGLHPHALKTLASNDLPWVGSSARKTQNQSLHFAKIVRNAGRVETRTLHAWTLLAFSNLVTKVLPARHPRYHTNKTVPKVGYVPSSASMCSVNL